MEEEQVLAAASRHSPDNAAAIKEMARAINDALTIILGHTSIELFSHNTEEDSRTSIVEIQCAVERCVAITDRMFALARQWPDRIVRPVLPLHEPNEQSEVGMIDISQSHSADVTVQPPPAER